MSVTLATAYVELIPTTRGIGPAVQRQFAPAAAVAEQAGAEAGERFSSRAESRIRAGAARIGNSLRTIVTLATGAGVAMGGVGLKTAAQMETSEIAFTTMLGSAQKAKTFLGDLSNFAAKTPFDLPGLQQSASSLISAGIEANKVIPIMTSLGNATSGMGTGAEGVQRATIAIQQMNAAGKIGAEDLNQLRDAGIPVFDLLTAATGKTKEEIAEMADKGKLGRQELEQLMTALETGKGLERFNGLMEKQSASLAGMVSTFKDTFSVGLAEAVKPAIPLLKQGLGGASTWLAETALPAVKLGLGEAVGGITAFGAAWKYNDGEVTSSGFPGFMERAAYWVHQVVDATKQLDFSSVNGFLSSVNDVGGTAAPLLADIGTSLGALWPAFQEFAAQAPTIATGGLKLLAGALGFLADHTDWIIDHMPLIVAGFVAWKVATLALNAAAAITPGLQLAVNASRIAAARSEMQLAGAHRAQAAAQTQANIANSIGATASGNAAKATIGQRLATLGASVAARAAAAGQWLLNAALTANPIGIVVAAIAVLVAGLVWFFTQTEVGRKIVQVAWAAIQAAAKSFVDWFMGNAMPVIKQVLGVIGAGFNWLWKNVIQPVFNFAGGAIRAFGMLVGKIFEIAVAVIRLVLGAAFNWLWTSVIRPVFGWIGGVISTAGRNWNTWLAAVSTFLRVTLGPAFTWLYRTIVKPAMDGLGGAIKWVWDHVISPVFNRISDAVKKNVPGAFSAGVTAIKTAWQKIQEVAKAPVRFVINQVINDGLIGGINGIATTLGISRLPRVALPPGFMHGGYTGPGPKHQVKGPVHAGEYVFTKEQTEALGKENLARLAHQAIRGHAQNGPMPGSSNFITGPVQSEIRRTGHLHLVPYGTFPMSTAQTAARAWNGRAGVKVTTGPFGQRYGTNTVAMRYGQIPGYAIGYYMGQGIVMEPGNALQKAVAVHEVGHALGLPHNTGNHSVMHPMLAGNATWPTAYDSANLRYLYGGPGAGARASEETGDVPDNPIANLLNGLLAKFREAFPGAALFADLAIAAGKKMFGAAVDWVWDKLGVVGDIIKNVTGLGQNVMPPIRPTSYDSGGDLPPGLNFIHNGTRRPEHVLTDKQLARITDGGGAPIIGELHMHQNEQPEIVVEMLARRLERAGRR
jgi:tape measure domain-containing protein